MQLSPAGVPGEIYVGGAGLARGYLNNPELTSQKFIADPFSETDTRLYRTGDIGRCLSDGNIDYLGRIDYQVKIRGYRIELGEIENVLLQSGLVRQTVVLANQDNSGNNRLIAYVVPEGVFDKLAVQAYLMKKLPEYMVPMLWVTLDNMPLTTNGKIDRNALPKPEITDILAGYIAPRTDMETALAVIWQELLAIERIGIYDNFFMLGGYSTLAMRMVSLIRKQLMVELTIKDIFIYPSIATLAWYLNLHTKTSGSLIPIKISGDKVPLYIICGAGGTVFTFREFADILATDQPVYGLQQPTENNEAEEFPDTIEHIANRYIKEILTQNPEGPYALSGHCLGGIIAFEMAGQLKAMGKKVTLLAMFDTVASGTQEIVPEYFSKPFKLPAIIKNALSKTLLKIKFEIFLLKKHPKQALLYKLNKLRLIMGSQITPDDEDFTIFNKVSLKFQKAASNYKIKRYDGDMLVFYAKEHYYFMDRINNVVYKELRYSDDTWNAWKKYAKSVNIFEVDGEHSDMFDKKYADKLAKIVQQHLNENSLAKHK